MMGYSRLFFRIIWMSAFFSPVILPAQGKERKEASLFYNDRPAHPYDIILSRPTDHSITVSLLAEEEFSGYIKYGKQMTTLNSRSVNFRVTNEKAIAVELTGLEADTRYYYQWVYTSAGKKEEQASPVYFFHTQRKNGQSFVFDIMADSHLDENTSTAVYEKTLQNIIRDSADLLLDLGDTWMTDKYSPDYRESLKQYLAQRYYFGLAARNSALFLTLGNHDGEYTRGGGRAVSDSMLSWSTSTRKKYYFNPQPDGFYTGDPSGDQNYYAWEWGDALFIVLDPFRYTKQNRDPWQRTLGKTQYDWLVETLKHSDKKLKFVFIHNLVGGKDNKGLARGGAEASRFYEWGGANADSTAGFTVHRPGWVMPIHDLLVKYRVNAVFHGHDHLFVQQERDGIIYQTLPQPGASRYGNTNSAAEYGYLSGVIKNAPGYLRVKISGGKASVEFVQSAADTRNENQKVLYSYLISSK